MKNCALLFFVVICSLKVSAQATDTILTSSKKELTTFIKAVNTAGLKNIFNGESVTIFAPDNAAFDKLPAGTLDSLFKPENHAALVSLLKSHIIAGKLMVKDIATLIHQNNGQTTFTALEGNKLIAKINANRNIVLVDEAGKENVVKFFNITQGNAVLYIISSVIAVKNELPPAK